MAEKSVHDPLEAAGDPKHAARATRSAGRKMRSLLLDAASPLFRERGLSGTAITDVRTLLQFVGFAGQFGLDSLKLAPGDSGVKSFEIVGLVRTWRGTTPAVSPREIALRSTTEGQKPGQVDFFSVEAAPALRPRLRLTYVPQTSFGLP